MRRQKPALCDEIDRVVADLVAQLANHPVNNNTTAVVGLPVGYALATLDPGRVEFWRRVDA